MPIAMSNQLLFRTFPSPRMRDKVRLLPIKHFYRFYKIQTALLAYFDKKVPFEGQVGIGERGLWTFNPNFAPDLMQFLLWENIQKPRLVPGTHKQVRKKHLWKIKKYLQKPSIGYSSIRPRILFTY
jgi:hypothetical protein